MEWRGFMIFYGLQDVRSSYGGLAGGKMVLGIAMRVPKNVELHLKYGVI
jgi:hypothetical protein